MIVLSFIESKENDTYLLKRSAKLVREKKKPKEYYIN